MSHLTLLNLQAPPPEAPPPMQAVDTAHAGASRVRKQMVHWQPGRAPADADLLPDLDLLVARSRDLDRNNGVAAGGFQTLEDNVVGLGLRLASTPDYRALGKTIDWAEDWSRQVESLWRTVSETTVLDVTGQMNFAALTQLVFQSILQNGEALVLPLWMPRQGTPFRTTMQMVDVDRLSNPEFEPARLTLRGGIEMDPYGKPVAYHIRKRADWPGMLFGQYGFAYGYGSIFTAGILEWERVPAETAWGRKRVLHPYRQTRPDQTRGKPLLTPIIEQFRMLDSYQRTELQSSIVNAIVAGIIETPLDPVGLQELIGGDPSAYLEKKNDYRVQLEGGTLIPLYPGDKLTPFTPARPPAQFNAFVEAVLRQIGAAMGMPYELMLKDFSKTNYSSARAALLEAWRFFINRRSWLATCWAQPVYELFLEEAAALGLIDAPNFYENRFYYARAKWIGPGRGWIDPVKEANAAAIRMRIDISTLEYECAEQGLDWNEVLEQKALERARRKQLGLEEPNLATGSGVTNAPPAEEEQPEEAPKDSEAEQEAA